MERPRTRNHMHRRRLAVTVALLAVAFPIAACGSDKEAEAAKEKAAQRAAARREQAAKERREAAAAKKMAATESSACQDALGDLVDALGEVDSRLNIGLTYDEYSELVSDARVIYDQLDVDEIGKHFRCLSDVGSHAEKALRTYTSAAGIWSECIKDYACDYDVDAAPKVQPKWATAGDQVGKARDGLRDLADPSTYDASDLQTS